MFSSKALGATVSYYAPAITGLNDGSAVSSWNDLSGKGNNASQSTSANQPTYKTGIIGGMPIVRFDGSGSYMTFNRIDLSSATVFNVFVRTSGGVISQNIIQVINVSNTRSAIHTTCHNNTTYGPLGIGSNENMTPVGKGGTLKEGTWRVLSGTWDGLGSSGATYYKLWDSNSSVSLSNTANVGAANGSASYLGCGVSLGSIGGYLKGDIASAVVFPSKLNESMRTRINSALGITFKIAQT